MCTECEFEQREKSEFGLRLIVFDQEWRRSIVVAESMISAEDANLERFGRHVPRILGNQIIAQLVDQYMSELDAPNIEPEFENSCPPSVERFHAALLFVDISGFTILSQRLPVDALRLHINAYFKKILDIIFKYGGDVIKFAGDALFIVWQTPICDLSTFAFF